MINQAILASRREYLNHVLIWAVNPSAIIPVMKTLKLGLQTQALQSFFPMDLFYRHRKNNEGQLSLFQQILRNPDAFCLADLQCKTSATEILKVQPDLDNKEVATLRSLNKIETLLYLADNGNSMQVVGLLAFPRSDCQDVLVLGLLQINPPITLLRKEMLGKLFKVFLALHPDSGVILANAWHSQSIQIKPILMLSMADWYLKAGQEGENEHSRSGSEYSMRIIHTRPASLHMRESVLSKANGGIPAHQARGQLPGSSQHYLQVKISIGFETKDTAYLPAGPTHWILSSNREVGQGLQQ